MTPAESSPAFEHAIASTGKAETFAKLSLDDIFCKILPKELERLKARKLANLKTVGATREEMLAELEAFDQDHESLDTGDLIAMVNPYAGKAQVIAFAYSKVNPDAKGSLDLTMAETLDIVGKLMDPFGITFGAPPADPIPPDANPLVYGDSKGDAPNPTETPLVYGK